MKDLILHGDVLGEIQKIPDNHINCCVTSPPYWGLRDYGHNGQLGLEKTPEEYVAKMVDIFREVKRVLKADGTVWLNLGDSYAGGGRGGDPKHLNVDNSAEATMGSYKGIPAKNLIGIPWMVAFALRSDGWYLRQDIIWHKPNTMPESVTDRCTKSHEYIFLLSKLKTYYFNSRIIMEDSRTTSSINAKLAPGTGRDRFDDNNMGSCPSGGVALKVDGKRNKRSVWTVNIKPSQEAHFAVFPPKLIKDCIKAGCPEGGIVLDPFMGSGTTALVAKEHGCHYIGIELNEEYIKIAQNRLKQEVLF